MTDPLPLCERRPGTAGERPSGPPPRGSSPARPDPAASPAAGVPRAHDDMPRIAFTRRQIIAAVLFVVCSVVFLYVGLPRLVGLRDTWNRLRQGNVWWLAFGALLEIGSFAGYVALFRGVFAREQTRVDWPASYQITMAGVAATRLLASAGAGGIALTAWALRRAGMEAREVAGRMIAFLAVLYGVYMATVVIVGLGLYAGIFPGRAPFAITVVPAILGAAIIAVFLGVSLVPRDLDGLVTRWSHGGRLGRVASRLATAPATAATGVRMALALVRRRDPHLLGAVAWWGFDIAVLWASFRAFSASPPIAVVVLAYFVGMIGNTLPLPGGVGGVDGGMIGAFSALGVDVEVAIVSVLAYRAFAFWLPTLPGAVAYLQLRRTVNRWQHEPAAQAAGR